MQVELAEERVLLLKDRFSMEHAEGRAWARRVDAFGALAKMAGLLARPRDEEFELVYRERRLQPFWRVVTTTVLAYERTRDYAVKVASETRSVTVAGDAFEVKAGQFTIRGLESCREENRRESLLDGLASGARPDLARYLDFEAAEIDAAALVGATAEGMVVVPPQARASMVARDAVAASIGKIDADKVLEELVRVEALDLYYRPVYAFRYRRQGKEAVVEFDALTGEASVGGATFEQYLGRAVDPKFLLDVGAEAVNMVIPGANLAKMVIVKSMEMRAK